MTIEIPSIIRAMPYEHKDLPHHDIIHLLYSIDKTLVERYYKEVFDLSNKLLKSNKNKSVNEYPTEQLEQLSQLIEKYLQAVRKANTKIR